MKKLLLLIIVLFFCSAAFGASCGSLVLNPITHTFDCVGSGGSGTGCSGTAPCTFTPPIAAPSFTGTGADPKINLPSNTTHVFSTGDLVNNAGVPQFNNGTATANVLLGTAFSALTDGATVTWAVSTQTANASLTFTVHSGSRTLNVTGLINGGSYVAWIKQDATGGEGLTLGTGCTWKVSGGGSGAVTPSATANAIDVLAFVYDGTNCYANFNKNFN